MANLTILLDVVSRGIEPIGAEIAKIGPAVKVSGQAWTIITDETPGQVLRRILPLLAACDKAFIVDSGSDKAAWYNFGPEFDSRMRMHWQKGQKSAAGQAVEAIQPAVRSTSLTRRPPDPPRPQSGRILTPLSAMAGRDFDDANDRSYLSRPFRALAHQG